MLSGISQRRGDRCVQGRRLKVSHVVGLNSAADSPSSAQHTQEVLNADSTNGNDHDSTPEGHSTAGEHPLLQQPPLEWFGPLAEELLALQPQKLGKVLSRLCTLSCNMRVFPLCLRSPFQAFLLGV